jgi:hypothetical protein
MLLTSFFPSNACDLKPGAPCQHNNLVPNKDPDASATAAATGAETSLLLNYYFT